VKILLLLSILLLNIYPQSNFWQKTSDHLEPTINNIISVDEKVLVTSYAGPVGTAGGLYLSSDMGNNWIKVLNPAPNDILFKKSNGYLFGSARYGGILISTNKGNSWFSTSYSTHAVISAICSDKLGYVYAGAADGLYGTTDNGGIWWSIPFPTSSVNALTVNSEDYIFAGTSTLGIFRSRDNGLSWDSVSNIYNIIFMGTDLINKIYACTGSGIYRSSDNGENWNQQNSGLGNLVIRCMAVNSLNQVYIGTNAGVYYTEDSGDNWIERNDNGLDTLLITSLAFDNDGYLYAGTWGDGVYRSRKTTLNIDNEYENKPEIFELSENYPNPFNSITNINLSCRKATDIKVVVFNTLGELVQIIYQGIVPGGINKFQWNAGHLPGGVYFITVVAGSDIAFTKAIFLK
jgi:photosystem II stability/assembly factor-like uncharacterized protein